MKCKDFIDFNDGILRLNDLKSDEVYECCYVVFDIMISGCL